VYCLDTDVHRRFPPVSSQPAARSQTGAFGSRPSWWRPIWRWWRATSATSHGCPAFGSKTGSSSP